MARPSRVRTIMLSVAAICLLTAALSPVASATDSQYAAGKRNVVVFPVKNDIGGDKAQLASDFQVLLKDALSTNSQFAVMLCDVDSNVSVQRAIAEQKIKADDFKTGFSTEPQGVIRAQKVCQAIATDLGVVSSLDTYSFDEATKEAKIGITVQIVKAIPDEKPFTIAVTGTAVGKPDDQSQTESGIAISALGDACNKAMSEISKAPPMALSAVPVGQQVDKPAPRSKELKQLLPAILIALLLGVALGGN